MRSQNGVGVESVQSLGSFPEDRLIVLFFPVVPRECGLFTAGCVIMCWAVGKEKLGGFSFVMVQTGHLYNGFRNVDFSVWIRNVRTPCIIGIIKLRRNEIDGECSSNGKERLI